MARNSFRNSFAASIPVIPAFANSWGNRPCSVPNSRSLRLRGLRRVPGDHLDPQLRHRPAELGIRVALVHLPARLRHVPVVRAPVRVQAVEQPPRLHRLAHPRKLDQVPSSFTKNPGSTSPVASSIATTRFHDSPGTHACVEASWCSTCPAAGFRTRRSRCGPFLLPLFTRPAS